jgi:site-specific recombinase
MVAEAHAVGSVQAPANLQRALAALDPSAPLEVRLDRLEDVARWVIEVPALKRLSRPAPLQLSHLRLLLQALAIDADARHRLTKTLGSVLAETTAVPLFAEAGMPSDRGLVSETIDRIERRVLPRPPDDHNLERFVSRVFRKSRDCAWIAEAPPELYEQLGDVLGDVWDPVREAMADAIALLCTRVSALGLSEDLRTRSDQMHVRDSPFFRLPHVPLDEIPMIILECRQQLEVIHDRLETTGVSVDVVYCIDAIRRMLRRIERMVPLVEGRGNQRERVLLVQKLLGALTAGRIADDSLRQLARQNLGLLARKVIERVGHTGEHYVTASRREYFKMLASAAGGGFLTAFTVIAKFITKHGHFAPFIDGLLSAGNYAASFLLMQFLGFTLATKQPSMTAAALAATIREAKGKHQLDDLVVLIARISRSQFAAACGNVLAVIPVAIVIDFLYISVTGHHFLDAKSAAGTIASFHPLKTGTIFFAALTGVLLWMSSLGAGWLENWVTYRKLPEALRHHRIGAKVLGRERMGKIADFVHNHAAGIGGNTTLGILLGMTPIMGGFFGLPLDVRHITLSTGSLTFAGCAVGGHAITLAPAIGIAIIGLCNFGVSFALALLVALRAKEVSGRERLSLAFAVLRRFLRHPLQFFFPPKNERPITAPTGH